jgi:hypothetical protein
VWVREVREERYAREDKRRKIKYDFVRKDIINNE